MEKTIFVPIMMFGWLPLTLILFALLGARKATVVSLVFGYLFLPNAIYDLPGLPDYTKVVATCLPILIGTLFFDSKRLNNISLSKLDIPIIIFCLSGSASSMSNGLGIYDAMSSFLGQIFFWGFPYAIGKMYFSDRDGLRELAIWVVIGGLIYIPFCLWEMRMAPTLNEHIYGFRNDRFGTTLRFDGYRPTVFLQHGLAVGLWMMSSVIMGLWLWRSRAVAFVGNLQIGLCVGLLFVTFLLCRSLNAIVLFSGGLFAFYVIRFLNWKSIIVIIMLIPAFYITTRQSAMVSTDQLVAIAENINEDRAQSLYGRLHHEERLAEKAWERPLFGWGGWGRNRVLDEEGNDTSVTDGFWVIAFGTYGLVGLISIGLVLLLPTFVFWRRYRFLDWRQPHFAPMVGFVTILPLYAIDCLMNAMLNPVFTVVAGGLIGWLSTNDDGSISAPLPEKETVGTGTFPALR